MPVEVRVFCAVMNFHVLANKGDCGPGQKQKNIRAGLG